MQSFPLLRKPASNERIMSVVFLVTLLYLLPSWVRAPVKIWEYFVVLAVALVFDAVANLMRYHRPVCGVSAAVTSAVLEVLIPGIPLWGRILGVLAALVSKHSSGGTGKNIFNPAVLGLLSLSLFFKLDFSIVSFSVWMVPVLLLSLLFLRFRPFAGMGLMAGMVLALLLRQQLSFQTIVSYGIVFWGCLIITDPVTTTPQPLIGLVGGLLIGFIPLYMTDSVAFMAGAFLCFNLGSYALRQNWFGLTNRLLFKPLKIGTIIPLANDRTDLLDLTRPKTIEPDQELNLTAEQILDRLQTCGVYGCGGAAFPAVEKIKSVMNSEVSAKYLIVNGIECDPGLIHDKWLLQNCSREISAGITAVRQCISFTGVFLAVKHREGLDFPEEIAIIKAPEFYPVGAEKILINQILHTKLADDAIPAQAGILVLNVQTILQIYAACYLNQHADTKYLTLANFKKKESRVVRVRLGEQLHQIVNQLYPHSNLVFCGGGLMQSHLADDAAEVEKTTNFIAVAEYPRYKESPLCSKCGWCMRHCPSGLEVWKIADLAEANRFAETEKYHPQKCISCGSCSYLCLAGRNLSAKVKQAKEFIKQGKAVN